MLRKSARRQQPSIARTIRFPEQLRDRISTDAERCGRSFEAQVLSILRSHYGENVELAPAPAAILALAAASVEGIPDAEVPRLVRRLVEKTRT
jgi:plasmid stability protein